MESTNIEFATKENGHKIIMKPFITGREKRSISEKYIQAAVIDDQGKLKLGSPDIQLNAATDQAILVTVISVDGNSDDIINRVLNLPSRDMIEVVERMNEITDNKKKEVSTGQI